MTKLVTIFGGSGFVGRYIAQRMAREGWRVRVAVRRPNDAHSHGSSLKASTTHCVESKCGLLAQRQHTPQILPSQYMQMKMGHILDAILPRVRYDPVTVTLIRRYADFCTYRAVGPPEIDDFRL